jgi:hypothetical protein
MNPPTTITPHRTHKWNPPYTVLPSESHDGNERTERLSTNCNLVKITVHPANGFPWREWRTHEGKMAYFSMTPPCLERVEG